jgi:hypothetical protein
MRGFAGLLAYLVGVSAIISIGIAALMALQSPGAQTPSAPIASAASHNENPATPTKQTIAAQKKARPDHKHKIVHVPRERTHEPPSTNEASYGYAQEPRRRIDPNLFSIFGR